jgi:hypothetical protein
MKTKLTTLLAIALFVAAGFCFATVTTSSSAPPPPPNTPATQIRGYITAMLNRKVPIKPLPDIPGGARKATNRDAAYFAWQEFIALNWANVAVTGTARKPGDPGARELADATKLFGQAPTGSSVSYPALVWESTRHRAEIFTPPASTSSPFPTPNGYTSDATKSWGYNSTPGYVYPGVTVNPASPSASGVKAKTPFVNLDEASQIGTCQMFLKGTEVLFMAKANFMEYGYVASRGWYNSALLKNPPPTPTPSPNVSPSPVTSFANTSGYIVTTGNFPTPGKLDGSKVPGSYVSFPNGTLEFKAAFRVATPQERADYEAGRPIKGGYHAAPIRYYQSVNGSDSNFQYVDTVGVLLSLHIIHKTPTAPYFIFATFEHTDDVLGPDGNPTEDADGNLNSNAFTTTMPTPLPYGTPSPLPSPSPYQYVFPSAGTAPAGQYLINATNPNVIEIPSQSPVGSGIVSAQIFIPSPSTVGVTLSTTQSAYQNTMDSDGTPTDATLPAANASPSPQAYITVNRRRFSIPQNPIVAVNQDVHSLIKMFGYSKANNVWLNYKLVNVQWVPAGNSNQKTPGKLYGDTSSGARPIIPVESFYLSNSLVETNMILSAFSGQFAGSFGDGLSITDFYDSPVTYTNNNAPGGPQSVTKNMGDPFYNIYTTGGPYNMGGCMGCHGNTAVNGGSDASFILGHGRPFAIEQPQPPSKTMIAKHRAFFAR